jgi:hypothetical protein
MSGLFEDMDRFMPHGHCYLWKPEIVFLHAVSDAVIVIAYYAIPIALGYVVFKAKGRLPFGQSFLLFAIFILACGTTHLLAIINIWDSRYLISGIVKAITAAASIATAVSLVPILPKVLATLKEADDDYENA